MTKIDNTKAKRVFVNMGWLSLIQIASYAFPLITMPYLARVIGVDGFGKIAFASAVVVWFQTITDWGFNFSGTREVARNADDNSKLSEIYSNILWSRLLLMIICFGILIALIFIIPKFWDNRYVILLTFLLIPGNIFCPDWFFQGLQKMKFMTISNVIAKSVFTGAVFIFIRNSGDYLLQPLLLSLGYITSGCFSTYIIIKKWGIKINRPNFEKILQATRSSRDIFINNIMPNFYNSVSVILLGYFHGSSANGMLDAGARFVTIGQQINHIISRAFYPLLAKEMNYHTFFRYLNLIIALLGSLLLCILSPWLITTFFTTSFDGSIMICRILSISIFFMALNGTFGTNYLILHGQERLLRKVTMFCSLIGLLSAIPLTYFFTYIGAALTITFTRVLLGLMVFLSAEKIKRYESCNS